MIVIKNSNDQMFCHPGTANPFVFDSFEQAEKLIESMGLPGAFVVDLDESGTESEPVERYGGDGDLW